MADKFPVILGLLTTIFLASFAYSFVMGKRAKKGASRQALQLPTWLSLANFGRLLFFWGCFFGILNAACIAMTLLAFSLPAGQVKSHAFFTLPLGIRNLGFDLMSVVIGYGFSRRQKWSLRLSLWAVAATALADVVFRAYRGMFSEQLLFVIGSLGVLVLVGYAQRRPEIQRELRETGPVPTWVWGCFASAVLLSCAGSYYLSEQLASHQAKESSESAEPAHGGMPSSSIR